MPNELRKRREQITRVAKRDPYKISPERIMKIILEKPRPRKI